VGVTAILLFGGYSNTVKYGLQTGFVRSGGHLQIQHKDYFLYGSGNPAAYGITNYDRVIDIIKRDPVLAPMITVVTPTLKLGGIAGNFSASVSRTVSASGAIINDQNAMRVWNDYGLAGNSAKPLALTNTSADSAVVGMGVARVLQLCTLTYAPDCRRPKAVIAHGTPLPADVAALTSQDITTRTDDGPRIQVLAASARGAPNVTELKVIKAESQGVKDLDDIYLAMHLEQAQRLIYGADAPQVTAIVIQLRHTSQIAAAKIRLQGLLATQLRDQPLEVQTFTTLNPSYGQTVGLFAMIFGFIAVLIGAIVLFTIGNTMSMAVLERIVEIGTLRAIGVRRRGIRRLFVCEGLLLGLLGSLVGVLISLALAALINHSGITWTPPGRVEPIPLTIGIWGETRLIVGTQLSLTFIAVLSAWLPAGRAARLQVVEALRHV
jgi:putative ABC transport system permease protein